MMTRTWQTRPPCTLKSWETRANECFVLTLCWYMVLILFCSSTNLFLIESPHCIVLPTKDFRLVTSWVSLLESGLFSCISSFVLQKSLLLPLATLGLLCPTIWLIWVVLKYGQERGIRYSCGELGPLHSDAKYDRYQSSQTFLASYLSEMASTNGSTGLAANWWGPHPHSTAHVVLTLP